MRIPNRGDYAYFKETGKGYTIRHLKERLADFESGEAYRKLEAENASLKRQLLKERTQHQKDLAKQEAKLKRESKRQIRIWQEAAEDSAETAEKAKAAAAKYKEKYRQMKKERDHMASERRRAQSANKKLVHRLGLDHTNSHKPSSMDPIGAKRKGSNQNNSRRKSGKKRGAQPGHPHHSRKQLEPTTDPVIHDKRPAGTENEEGCYKTDRTVTKLEMMPRIVVDVVPHRSGAIA